MNLKEFSAQLQARQLSIPIIREGKKTKGIVLKRIGNGVLVDCDNNAFTGVILSKEVKELERGNYDLTPGQEVEVEIVNTFLRHEDGHFIVSITKLLQYDIRQSVLAKFEKDEMLKVTPTEANL